MSAEKKLAAFVAGLTDADAGSPVAGLYLVGSHALADVTPDSDIDFIGVLSSSWQETGRAGLVALHQRLVDVWPVPFLDGHYVQQADLRRPPEDVVPVLTYLRGELVPSASGAATPVEWLTLKSKGVRLIGAPVDDLDVHADVDAVRSYCRRNLVEYWRPQVERLSVLAEVEPLLGWIAYQVAWIALGVPRLLVSIATGEVVSKSAAGRYALERFPEFHRVLEASLGHRRDPRPEQIPVLAGMAPEVIALGRRCIDVGLANR